MVEPEKEIQETTEADSDESGALIPPAPFIVKKDPRSISIPLEGIVRVPKFEQRPAVSSNVKVGSVFGYRRDPFTRRSRFHSGIDIKAKWGDPVAASHPGTVQFAGWYHGYGNLIIIDHGGGVTTYYAHLSSYALVVGQKVERGTVVGNAGSTGRATSPHLHYEVRIDGNAINPFQQVALDPSSPFFKISRPSVNLSTTPDPTSNKTGSQK
jgi:murein DD-endopeptidase MepM/ murein hydrolase activator NlpD